LLLDNDAGGRLRHAFIGIGFRERTEAYDFQAALHDHMKYPSISSIFWIYKNFIIYLIILLLFIFFQTEIMFFLNCFEDTWTKRKLQKRWNNITSKAPQLITV